MISQVIDSDKQSQLTPEIVLDDFKEGNGRFAENKLKVRDFPQQVKNSTGGQFPKAIVLSCVDSRVPVEYVFDQGIGDIFVTRVAGNIVNKDILGSMEFACKVSGSKLILVMGHEHCGAVKAAVENVELGNITSMIAKIKPAIEMSKNFKGEQISDNDNYVYEVCRNNVRIAIDTIRSESPVLKEMEYKGEIKIAGAIYSLTTGKADFLT